MATHYRVRQKLVAIGDDFWIENESGERAYRVDGKALRLRKTLVFEDVQRERTVHDLGAQAADQRQHGDRGMGGRRLAMVKKALIAPLLALLEGSTPSFLDQEPRR